MTQHPDTMNEAMLRFKGEGQAYIICGPSEPDGRLGFAYQGDLRQLKAMFRFIRDQLKEREKIGNHPARKSYPRPPEYYQV
jgi:hypothetical protein